MTDLSPSRLSALADSARGILAQINDNPRQRSDWERELVALCENAIEAADGLTTILSTPAAETARRVLELDANRVAEGFDYHYAAKVAPALAAQNVALLAERDTKHTDRNVPCPKCGFHIRKINEARAENERLVKALRLWIDEGYLHEDGCPEDDTCDCAVAIAVNQALSPTGQAALASAEARARQAEEERDKRHWDMAQVRAHEMWKSLNGLDIDDATKRAEWFFEQSVKGKLVKDGYIWDEHKSFMVKALAENMAAYRTDLRSANERLVKALQVARQYLDTMDMRDEDVFLIESAAPAEGGSDAE